MSLSCIVCRTPLRDVFPDGSYHNQPSEGTVFMSHGHYGSTYFDSLSVSEYIEINVCDACLRNAEQHDLVLHVQERHVPREYDVKPFRSDE